MLYKLPEPEPEPEEDFIILYSEKDVVTNDFDNLNSSDNWLYYNPAKDADIYFALMTKTKNTTDKLEVLKINKSDNTVVKCSSTTNEDNIYWNDKNVSSSAWLDVKVIYTTKGDYAYMCAEGDGLGNSTNSYNNKVVHIYKLDSLYEDSTYECVNTIPGISYHNLSTFQSADKNVAYLYGVGGNRNALEIYDLSIDPSKPFYLGGYLAYPEGYNHIHTTDVPQTNESTLYIHDMCVSDKIPGLEGKIVGFAASIYWTSIVALDLTDPVNIKSLVTIIDPRYQNVNSTQGGLHHCWITPNNEFLICGAEEQSKKMFVIDISSIFSEPEYYYNQTVIETSTMTKYVGELQILSDLQGINLHNQYCYKIKDDTENFILLSAAYASGTHVHKVNYESIRTGLLNVGEEDNLQACLVQHQRLYEDGESESVTGTVWDGVWSVSYCPNSKIVFDSCSYNGSPTIPTGLRVFKVNSMPEVEDNRHVPANYAQIVEYSKKMVVSKDPQYLIHPGFYRLIIRNTIENYHYEIKITDNTNNETLKSIAYGKGQIDLGHFSNSTTEDISYVITVVEYDDNNVLTGWDESQIINIEPHTYMPMNGYTSYNQNMMEMMHPSINLQSEDINFTYAIEEFNSIAEDISGYKLYLDMSINSIGKFCFENVSMNDDPGWSGIDTPGKYSCHSHYYTYERITGVDSEGTSYDGYKWVKKGRLFQENWVNASKIDNMWVKILLSSNNHGTIYNTDGNKAEKIFKMGNPESPIPELNI